MCSIECLYIMRANIHLVRVFTNVFACVYEYTCVHLCVFICLYIAYICLHTCSATILLVELLLMMMLHLIQVGGVPTNFRLPDVPSIGLGGGSIVKILEEEGKKVNVYIFSFSKLYY